MVVVELIIVACVMQTLHCVPVYTKYYNEFGIALCNYERAENLRKYKLKFPKHEVYGKCKYQNSKEFNV